MLWISWVTLNDAETATLWY